MSTPGSDKRRRDATYRKGFQAGVASVTTEAQAEGGASKIEYRFSLTGNDGCAIVLSHWPEGYTLERHGEIVWREWLTVAACAAPKPQTGWENEEKLTFEQAWEILCNADDRTSPEDYPDHALITMDELGSFMARARPELYDADAFMADGEIPMTAAENVLAWLLVEKIGVVDDIGYSPNQAREIIVASIEDAGRQLVHGGEMPLKAEAAISDMTSMMQAAKEVISCATDSYKKRNGHLASFEDDSGEKCWIVPFDAFEGLRSACAAVADQTPEGAIDG